MSQLHCKTRARPVEHAERRGTAGWVPVATGEEARQSRGDRLLWAKAPTIQGHGTRTAAGAEVGIAQHGPAEPGAAGQPPVKARELERIF